jgi:hypothetical protein
MTMEDPMHQSALYNDRRGVTLVTSLLLVLLISVAVIAGFMRTSADRRATLDASGAVDAYAAAQNGIDRFITQTPSQPTVFPTTASYTVPGGTANVRIERVRQETSVLPAMYLLTSTGTSTGNRYDPRTARAARTVGQLLQWSKATLVGAAALTTLNGIEQAGNPATYDGRNGCFPADPTKWAPGLQMLDADDFTKSGSSKKDPEIFGTQTGAITEMGTLEQALDALGFDWNTVVSSVGGMPNVYSVPQAQFGSKDFGGYNFPDTSVTPWPIILIDNKNYPSAASPGSYAANKPGHGILIVTGDFETSGNAFGWDGLVLVGGRLIVNGNSTWTGSVYAGLNNNDPLNPSVVTDNSILGTKTFKFNSCTISKALSGFSGWMKLPNTRVDNIPNY